MPQMIENMGYPAIGVFRETGKQGQRDGTARGEFNLVRRAPGKKVVSPNSLYNLYLDHADGRPYYHRAPWSERDMLLVRGVCIEVLWAKEFVLMEILAWYNKRHPERMSDAARELMFP